MAYLFLIIYHVHYTGHLICHVLMCRAVEKALNSRFTGVDIRNNQFVDLSKHELKKHVIGNELEKVLLKGKYLFLTTQKKATIVMHFGMTGFLHYAPEKDDPPKYVKCIFKLDNRHNLHYVSSGQKE